MLKFPRVFCRTYTCIQAKGSGVENDNKLSITVFCFNLLLGIVIVCVHVGSPNLACYL